MRPVWIDFDQLLFTQGLGPTQPALVSLYHKMNAAHYFDTRVN